MKTAPISKNEKERLISLHKLGFLDTAPEERFDKITRTATKVFNVPISTLTLVDEKREWFKSVCGLDQKEGDRAISFCGHALLANEIFIIRDTKKDKRFSDNPMVTGSPYIRFYVGVPIMNADGQRIGVFCIKDTKPRQFSKSSVEIIKNLTAWAELEINSRNLSLALIEGQKLQSELEIKTQELENAEMASQNVLEDLNIEKSKVDMARAKEEAILLSVGDGLITTDEKGTITLINKPAEKLFGRKGQEIMGKSFFEVISIEDEKGVSIPLEKRPVKMALAGTTTTGPTYYYVRPDKTKFPVAITVTPIIIDGKIIGTIEVFRDITREKNIDNAKTEFVSLASHQLRTPLTTISWYTEMILHGDVGKIIPSQKKYLEEIYQGNHRMIELVNTLLNVSRLELGTFKVEPKLTDMLALAQSVLDEQKPNIEKKKLVIIENFSKDIPTFSTDSKLLRMVFQNILSNAVEYTPKGGKIEFTISRDKKTILIKVSDTGYGIPKSQQDKIFDKFFRADNVRDKDTDGTGLGLYIVKSIILNSGGKIWFESEENKGTTFYVTLPLTGMKRKEGTKTLY